MSTHIQKASAASKAPERKSVMLDLFTHQQLDKAAKKLHIGNGEYVSAAIAYFVETGLDPTAERPAGLANVSEKVSQEMQTVRRQNVDIGDRLIGIIRTLEKTLYGFLQQQQAGTLNYLEQIENSILRHQVAVESNLLAPMVELIMKGNIEAQIARIYGVRTHLYVTGKQEAEKWTAQNLQLNGERNEQLLNQLEEFTHSNNVTAPVSAAKPQVPLVPVNAPSAVSGEVLK